MMQWISVKDRLPSRAGLMDDESEYVLVFEQYKHIPGGEVSICAYTKDGWSDHDNFGNVHTERITHWMPLPEPPEDQFRDAAKMMEDENETDPF